MFTEPLRGWTKCTKSKVLNHLKFKVQEKNPSSKPLSDKIVEKCHGQTCGSTPWLLTTISIHYPSSQKMQRGN